MKVNLWTDRIFCAHLFVFRSPLLYLVCIWWLCCFISSESQSICKKKLQASVLILTKKFNSKLIAIVRLKSLGLQICWCKDRRDRYDIMRVLKLYREWQKVCWSCNPTSGVDHYTLDKNFFFKFYYFFIKGETADSHPASLLGFAHGFFILLL